MISVVMLNWKRPENVKRNAAAYLKHARISEVLVFSNAPERLRFESRSDDLVLIESSRDLGLYTRLAIATLSANRCVMLTDDDLQVPASTIDSLHEAWLADPNICHSLHGRRVDDDYQGGDVHGPCEVVLTRCTLVDRVTCARALSVVHEFEDMSPDPRGNGEDIILSFTAMAHSRRLNLAHDLEHADDLGCRGGVGSHSVAIHIRWPGHHAHREQVVERCRRIFGIEAGSLPAPSRVRPTVAHRGP